MDNNPANIVDNPQVKPRSCADSQNFWLWLGALVIGGVLGCSASNGLTRLPTL